MARERFSKSLIKDDEVAQAACIAELTDFLDQGKKTIRQRAAADRDLEHEIIAQVKAGVDANQVRQSVLKGRFAGLHEIGLATDTVGFA